MYQEMTNDRETKAELLGTIDVILGDLTGCLPIKKEMYRLGITIILGTSYIIDCLEGKSNDQNFVTSYPTWYKALIGLLT